VIRAPERPAGDPRRWRRRRRWCVRAAGPGPFSTARYWGAKCLVHLEEIEVGQLGRMTLEPAPDRWRGPMPMMDGSQPAMPQPTSLPEASAFPLGERTGREHQRPRSVADAAGRARVITPSFLKTFASLARLSSVVSGGCARPRAKLTHEPFLPGSPWGNLVARRPPLLGRGETLLALHAVYSSTSFCEMPYFVARFSAVMAIGRPV